MNNSLLKLLNKYLEGEISTGEKRKLEDALKKSPALRKEKERLEKLMKLFSEQKNSFSPGFANKVLNRIKEQQVKVYDFSRSINLAFRNIALPGLAAAILLILLTIAGGGSFSLESLIGLESLQPEDLSEFLIYNF